MNKDSLIIFLASLAYAIAIATGAERYLPYQIYAPGVFRAYSYQWPSYVGLTVVALLATYMMPRRIKFPSDWYILIFNILLFAPMLVLGLGSDSIDIEKKIVVILSMIACMSIIRFFGNVIIIKNRKIVNLALDRRILFPVFCAWAVIFFALIVKYHGVMQFSTPDLIYEQRELTGDVGGVWGYIQLYSLYVFSTLLIAYGFSSNRWLYFLIGSAGYFIMYLITAEKSHLVFPIFFLIINYLSQTNDRFSYIISCSMFGVASVIYGVIYLGDEVVIFDLAGFYLFSRIIATPSQFVLDYYDFFSTSGYTFFSHIRGFNLLIDPPSVYAADPKWPQLGWIVGSGSHGIESNSNATFIASDGSASLGGPGMILMAFVLSIYLVLVNSLSQKLPRIFWSIIFAQQAYLLVSASLFSVLLSFGGIFFLLFFYFYSSKARSN